MRKLRSSQVSEYVRPLPHLTGISGSITAIEWSRDGRRLGISTSDGVLSLWDVKTGSLRFKTPVKGAQITDLAWSMDGRHLACINRAGELVLCDGLTLTPQKRLSINQKGLARLEFSPGENAAVAGLDGNVYILDLWNGGHSRQVAVGHQFPVRSIVWSPDASMLVSGTEEGFVGIWTNDTEDNQLRQFLPGPSAARAHDGCVTGLAWSARGRLIASSSKDHTVRIWNSITRKHVRAIDMGEPVFGVAFAPEGTAVVARTLEKIAVLAIDSGESIHEIDCPASDAGHLAAHLKEGLLAAEDHIAGAVRSWHIDFPNLLTAVASPGRSYRNAKVVILGPSGEGRSRLTEALMGQRVNEPAGAPPSGSGRKRLTVSRMGQDIVEGGQGCPECRELALWDFQPLPTGSPTALDRLNLADTDVAVVVCDEGDTAEAAPALALLSAADRQRSRHQSFARSDIPIILVQLEAKRRVADRGEGEEAKLRERLGVDETLKMYRIPPGDPGDLRELIKSLVAWESSGVESEAILSEIREFIETQRNAGLLMVTERSLCTLFQVTRPQLRIPSFGDLFGNAIDALQKLGLAYRFPWGDQVLLAPEYLQSYSAHLAAAAARDPEGTGRLPVAEAYAGRGQQLVIEDADRIPDSRQEHVFLAALVKNMIGAGLISEVSTDGVSYIVFPSRLSRLAPGFPGQKAMGCTFGGDASSVHSSLLVRLLGLPLIFPKADLFQDGAIFHAKSGGTCSVSIRRDERQEKAHLATYLDAAVSELTRDVFHGVIRSHIEQEARSHSIVWTESCAAVESASDLAGGHRRQDGVEVLLCYEDIDLADAIEIGEQMKERGISPHLRSWHGRESAIRRSRELRRFQTAVVLLRDRPSRALYEECIELRRLACTVVAAILPGAGTDFSVPRILDEVSVVDFRVLAHRPYERLAELVKSHPRGTGRYVDAAVAEANSSGHAFLSYCRDDAAEVRSLVRDLRESGCGVKWDDDLRPGEDWKMWIHDTIRSAYAMIVCFSATSVRRERSGVFTEISYAAEVLQSLQPGSIYLLPVLLSPCAIPQIRIGDGRWLSDIQAIDLTVWDREAQLAKLRSALESARSRNNRASMGAWS